MEICSTINEKWRFCIFACFVGSIILLYCLNHDQDSVNLLVSGNTDISTTSSNDSEQHSAADMAFAASGNIAITMTSSNHSNQHSAADMQFLQPSNTTGNGTNVNEKEDSCNIFDGMADQILNTKIGADKQRGVRFLGLMVQIC
ncbi:uncharacterized protein LOC121248541 isoform X2 [Juglans microcarpa x Juglans regia]|uniref:uncharacterized protein LOC121248541 isoform X2 n=1 Tax=Juglans microcarpa x Juglans regia TaxID=2249226 RepID=UPI001B7E0C04|nr:uncharacterized protein LOC121248541 isoform X2 [Juglans microcarpa x Juglans regia]